MTREDLNDLEMLKNINIGILKKYRLLYELENLGKKDSEEYKNISEEIKHDIELEKGSISRLTITPEKCQSVVQYLRSTDEFKNGSFKNMRDFSIVIALADLTDEEVIFAYIYNIFIQKKIENPDYLLNVVGVPKEAIDESMAEEKRFIAYQINLAFLVCLDSLNLTLAIMERQKREYNNSYLKVELNKLAYNLAFMIPNLRNSLINQNFKFELNPFLVYQTASSIYNFPPNTEIRTKNAIVANCTNSLLSQIIAEPDDIYFTIPENIAILLSNQAEIRAFLVMADDQTRKLLVAKIKECINKLPNSNVGVVKSCLENILEKLEEDKSIPQIVSFGRI